MKFMLFMIPQVYQSGNVADDFEPSAEMIAKMTRFNEELIAAGILMSLEGLHPPKQGVRVMFSGGEPRFTEAIAPPGNVIGGFWMLDVASKDEAVAWARRVPAEDGDCIEVRQVYAMEEGRGDRRETAEREMATSLQRGPSYEE